MPKVEVEKTAVDLSDVYFGSTTFDRRSCQRFIDEAVKESRATLIALGHDPYYTQLEQKQGFTLKDWVKYPSHLPASDRDQLLVIFLPAALVYARSYYHKVRATIGSVEESDFQFVAVDGLQATIKKFWLGNNRTGAFLDYLQKAVNSKITNLLESESIRGATCPKEPAIEVPVDLNGKILMQDLNSTFSHHELNKGFFESLKTADALKVLKSVIPDSGALLENIRLLMAHYGLSLEFAECEPLSYEQISLEFKIPIKTVGTKIHRAKYALRQALIPSEPEPSIELEVFKESEAA